MNLTNNELQLLSNMTGKQFNDLKDMVEHSNTNGFKHTLTEVIVRMKNVHYGACPENTTELERLFLNPDTTTNWFGVVCENFRKEKSIIRSHGIKKCDLVPLKKGWLDTFSENKAERITLMCMIDIALYRLEQFKAKQKISGVSKLSNPVTKEEWVEDFLTEYIVRHSNEHENTKDRKTNPFYLIGGNPYALLENEDNLVRFRKVLRKC